MLDHVFLAVIEVLRESFSRALLDGQTADERLQVDVLLGDVSWEASYSLPGEPTPARIRADVGLDWPTWSQTAYRSWMIGEPLDEPPEVGVELVLHIQELAGSPDVGLIATVLPAEGPVIGRDALVRTSPSVEQLFTHELSAASWAVEFAYEGSYEIGTDTLERRQTLERDLGPIGGWTASSLVRLGDLNLEFRPDLGEEGAEPA